MRKIFTLLFALILTAGLFAAAAPESEQPAKPLEISILYSGLTDIGGQTDLAWATAELRKEFPGIIVTGYQVDLSDGSLLTMTTLLASDDAPNIYMDTLVRSSAFIRADFALPLDEYITDIEQYDESALAPFRRDGKLLGLPLPGGAQAMALNLDMMKDIGYTVPDNWTIADFLTMAAKVKAKYGGEKYATGMFAANQSGDYLINNWFAAFGAEYYNAGDYSKTTIKETGGAVVHEFFQELMRAGYIPENSAELTDDDYVLQWARGEIAATAFFQPWVKPYQDVVAAQGFKPFNYKFVPFPRAPWVDAVPTYYMTAAMVVHKTGTPEDAAAAMLVQLLNSAKIQTVKAAAGNLANRADVTAVPDDPWTAQIMAIVKANGIFDVGLTNEKYSATRPQHFPILQKVLNLSITPDESIKAYEAAINEALSW
jgi:ABC-type glycerol-3-phosphate transport system substrate-binding protein